MTICGYRNILTILLSYHRNKGGIHPALCWKSQSGDAIRNAAQISQVLGHLLAEVNSHSWSCVVKVLIQVYSLMSGYTPFQVHDFKSFRGKNCNFVFQENNVKWLRCQGELLNGVQWGMVNARGQQPVNAYFGCLEPWRPGGTQSEARGKFPSGVGLPLDLVNIRFKYTQDILKLFGREN